MSCCKFKLTRDTNSNNKKALTCFLIGILLALLFYLFQKNLEKEYGIGPLVSALVILILIGYHVILEGFIDTWQDTIKNKKFTPNIHILMTLAALGALYLQEYNDAILLIIIFSGASFLEEYIEHRSQKDIQNLMKLHVLEARLLKNDGSTEIIASEKLQIKDLVLILNGEQIPTDGTVISGNPHIDESNITGESIHCEKEPGDFVYGNTINGSSNFVMEVIATNEKTIFAQIIKLVEQTKNNISKTATVIKKIEPIYVKAIMLLVVILLASAVCFDASNFKSWFTKIMIFLTVSSPCALAAADIPSTLAAISNLAKKGILFKNSRTLEIMPGTKAFACDKTGTLTEGIPQITNVWFEPSINSAQKQAYLEILLGMEKQSNHPLSFAIKNYFKNLTTTLQIEITNSVGIGLEAIWENKHYKIAKAKVFDNIPETLQQKTKEFLGDGKTVIYFSCNNCIIIAFALLDKLRPEASNLINYFNAQNIYTTLITGDNEQSAQTVKKQLNLKEAWGNILPQHKLNKIKELQKKYGTTIMVGDGVNDAPALITSDIGIAMQNGVDVAINVADAVLMKNDLEKIIYTHRLSVKLRKIIWQNIIFAMTVVVCLNIVNLLNWPRWNISLPWAVSCHEGSTLIVILNGLRLLKTYPSKEQYN